MTSRAIRTPDQRLRVFVSSTLGELADERKAVRAAVEQLRLSAILFELGGAAPSPAGAVPLVPRAVRRVRRGLLAALWLGRTGHGDLRPGDEYVLSAGMPRLVYVKRPAPAIEPRLEQLLDRLRDDNTTFAEISCDF